MEAAGPQAEDQDQDHVGEARVPPVPRCPREPTAREREEHDVTHWPRRPWCLHCNAGCMVSGAHGAGMGDDERTIPTLSLDYTYLGASAAEEAEIYAEAKRREENGEAAVDDRIPAGSVPVLVLHDYRSTGVYAVAVDQKGPSARVVARVLEVLGLLGYQKLILKSDQEPALVGLKKAVREG